MKIGELDHCNFRKQTLRTMSKLDESKDFVMTAILESLPDGLDPAQYERITRVVYNALRWTADDVLGQAVEDGYQAKH